jgi:hypothetical protein
MQTAASGFRIGVGSHPTAGGDAENELRMAKSSLLYADHVQVYSPICAMLRHIASLGAMPKQHATRLAIEVVYYTGQLPFEDLEDAIQKLSDFILGPDRKKGYTQKSTSMWKSQRDLRRVIEGTAEKFHDQCAKWIGSPAFVELREAENAGVLSFSQGDIEEISAYDYLADFTIQAASPRIREGAEERSQKFNQAMADLLYQTVVSAAEYPLLDKSARALVRTMIESQHIKPSVIASRGGKISGFGDALVCTLPVCDLPMNELLSVRDELRILSSRFHSALRRASETVESMQWDKGFEQEVSIIVNTHVMPAVSEIENTIREDRGLRKVFSLSTNETLTAIGSGGVVWAYLDHMTTVAPALAAGVATSAAMAAAIANRLKQKHEGLEKLMNNDWFFYYEARKAFERQ